MIIVSYLPASPAPEECLGKFVQLYWGGAEYLIFAPFTLYGYHVRILTRFLEENQIPYGKLGQDYLVVKDSQLNVVGGGRFKLDPIGGTLELWDNSQAYGPFDPTRLAEKIAESWHDWNQLTVKIS